MGELMVPMPEDSYCRDGKMETVSQNKLWANNETKPKQYLNGVVNKKMSLTDSVTIGHCQ